MKGFTLDGYARAHGKVGLRNYLAIIPTVFCVNDVAETLARRVPGLKALVHQHGCCELKPDLERTTRVLSGLIENANLGACVILSLGCEGVQGEELMRAARRAGKPAVHVLLHREGGMRKSIARCLEEIRELRAELEKMERTEFDASRLVVGVKCGSSDATSGLAANPAVGACVDAVLDCGGSVIFGETTEFIGAEHILAKRCRTGPIQRDLLDIVARMEARIQAAGVDLRGSQPTPGNIKGGLTTIEEKSLGAICKSGSKPIDGILEYAQPVPRRGLYVMDSPGKEDEIMTGLAAAGANLILFATGGGAPQGFPIVPVVKVASHPQKCIGMKEHIDIDASGVLSGRESIEELGERIVERVLQVASGAKTKAERLHYDRTMGIYASGPTV